MKKLLILLSLFILHTNYLFPQYDFFNFCRGAENVSLKEHLKRKENIKKLQIKVMTEYICKYSQNIRNEYERKHVYVFDTDGNMIESSYYADRKDIKLNFFGRIKYTYVNGRLIKSSADFYDESNVTDNYYYSNDGKMYFHGELENNNKIRHGAAYEYDMNQNTIKASYTNDGKLDLYYKYKYNSSNDLTEVIGYTYIDNGFRPSGFSYYDYDKNDNKIGYRVLSPDAEKVTEKRSYIYENNILTMEKVEWPLSGDKYYFKYSYNDDYTVSEKTIYNSKNEKTEAIVYLYEKRLEDVNQQNQSNSDEPDNTNNIDHSELINYFMPEMDRVASEKAKSLHLFTNITKVSSKGYDIIIQKYDYLEISKNYSISLIGSILGIDKYKVNLSVISIYEKLYNGDWKFSIKDIEIISDEKLN